MKTLITVFFVTALFGSITSSNAQDKMSVEFGKVTPQDFEVKPPSADLNANAIVVADWGSSNFIGNISYNFGYNPFGQFGSSYNNENVLEFNRKTRIKIVNKKGFDAASVNIRLFISDNSTEKLDKLIAYTYNLKNGKVIKSKVINSSIITTKESKNWVVKKFNFPSVQEGSLIEYSYTIQSIIFSNLYPWYFQGKYPHLWSEYNVCIPDFIKYTTTSNGIQDYFINKTEPYIATYTASSDARMGWGWKGWQEGKLANDIQIVGESFKLSGENHKWVMKDVAAVSIDSSKKIIGSINSLKFRLVPVDSIYRASILKKIDVPKSFSPNGDGVNDKWEITGLSKYPEAVVKVYRAGRQLLFESKGYAKAWDGTFHGKPLPPDTYYYFIWLEKDKPSRGGSVIITN